VEHFGGHEMAEIVEPEASQPSNADSALEGFGHPVRPPRLHSPAVVGEHESVAVGAANTGGDATSMSGKDAGGRGVEFDGVTAFGLGVGEHRPERAFDPAVSERHLAVGEVDVAPTQPE
jgi:hypothetical protein